MTTTMSCSKKSFWHLYRSSLGRLWGFGLLYTVLLQFTYTLPLYMDWSNHARTCNNMADHFSNSLGIASTIFQYSIVSIFCTSALVCFGAVLLSAVAYSYMHDRRAADFYHALPVRRSTLLLSNFAAVFTVLAVPLLASGLISVAYTAAFAPAGKVGQVFLAIGKYHAVWLLILFILLCFTAFTAVNAATSLETVGYSCLFSVVGSLLYLLWVLLSNLSFETYPMPETTQTATYLSPVFAAALGVVPSAQNMGPLLLWAVLGVALLLVSLALYSRRPSEIAQQWGYQSTISFAAKALASVFGAVVMGSVFALLQISPHLCFLLGALVGAPLGYIMAEVITAKGFSSLKKALPRVGAATVAVLCLSSYFASGGFGYDSRVPAPATVTKIEMVGLPNFYGYSCMNDEDALAQRENGNLLVVQTPPLIEAATQLHYSALSHDPDIFSSNALGLHYTTKTGSVRRVLRNVSNKSVMDFWATPGYMQASNPFAELKPEYILSATVFDRLLQSKGQLAPEQLEQLLQAIRQDFEEQTIEQMLDTTNNREVGLIRFTLHSNAQIMEQYNELYHYSEPFFFLRPQCRYTMALLEQWGYTNWQPDASIIKSVDTERAFSGELPSMLLPQISHYELDYPGSSWSIDDPAAIAEILAAASFVHTGEVGEHEVFFRLPASYQSAEGQAITMYLSNEKLIEICAAHHIPALYTLTQQDYDAILQSRNNRPFSFSPDYWNSTLSTGFVSVGQYLERHCPHLLEGRSQAVRDAMYRTPFLDRNGGLMYDCPLGQWQSEASAEW